MSEGGGEVIFGKFLDKLRLPAHTWFLSSIGAGLLPASFVGLGKIPYGLARFLAAWKSCSLTLLLSVEQEVWQPASVKMIWNWRPKRVYALSTRRFQSVAAQGFENLLRTVVPK